MGRWWGLQARAYDRHTHAAPQHADHHAAGSSSDTQCSSGDTRAWAAEQARRMRRLRIVPVTPPRTRTGHSSRCSNYNLSIRMRRRRRRVRGAWGVQSARTSPVRVGGRSPPRYQGAAQAGVYQDGGQQQQWTPSMQRTTHLAQQHRQQAHQQQHTQHQQHTLQHTPHQHHRHATPHARTTTQRTPHASRAPSSSEAPAPSIPLPAF
ncbi:hypothetical protein C8J57DRAFT_476179 [Mycena rebaudengoi]|nr:hypothetical protein C8J57DRAFT_476179 [Mycena rebaudengoi]